MAKQSLGYQNLIDTLSLRVRPLQRKAVLSSAVNRKNVTETEILFPKGGRAHVGVERVGIGVIADAAGVGLESSQRVSPNITQTRSDYGRCPIGE